MSSVSGAALKMDTAKLEFLDYNGLLVLMKNNREMKLDSQGTVVDESVDKVREIIKTAIESKINHHEWTVEDISAALMLVRELFWNYPQTKKVEEHAEMSDYVFEPAVRCTFSIAKSQKGKTGTADEAGGSAASDAYSGAAAGDVSKSDVVSVMIEHWNKYIFDNPECIDISLSSCSNSFKLRIQSNDSAEKFKESLKSFDEQITSKTNLADAVDEVIKLIGKETVDVYGKGLTFTDGIVSAILQCGNPFGIEQTTFFAAPFVDRSFITNSQ